MSDRSDRPAAGPAGPRRDRVVWSAIPAIAGAFLFALAAPGVAQTAQTVEVNPARVYTPTGITVEAGDKVQITATGRIAFGGGPIANLGPNGIPWGPRCTDIAESERRAFPWPAQGLSCWSLFARVGPSDPVEIGSGATFTAERGGQLRLGLNDNYAGDNTGTFTAEVTLNPPAGPTTTGTPGGPTGPAATSDDEGGSSAVLFVVIGAVVVLGLGLLLFFRRRRRGEDDEPVAAPEPAPPVAPVAAAPEMQQPEPVPAAPGILIAPPDPESIDVNIFEVEFVNGLQLRVGYNHFPDGTPVNWRVLQARKPVSVGSFVAQGGGSTNHFETANLGVKLEGRDAHPDGADVQFDWSINGVPFRYSVRRDPNC
jgi:LPXTG-motif cell wall-anchored protein